MPRISKDKIKINAFDNTVEVKSEDPQSTIRLETLLGYIDWEILKQPNLFTIMEYYKSCLKRSKQKDETIDVGQAVLMSQLLYLRPRHYKSPFFR
jgi:hypothetical protein